MPFKPSLLQLAILGVTKRFQFDGLWEVHYVDPSTRSHGQDRELRRRACALVPLVYVKCNFDALLGDGFRQAVEELATRELLALEYCRYPVGSFDYQRPDRATVHVRRTRRSDGTVHVEAEIADQPYSYTMSGPAESCLRLKKSGLELLERPSIDVPYAELLAEKLAEFRAVLRPPQEGKGARSGPVDQYEYSRAALDKALHVTVRCQELGASGVIDTDVADKFLIVLRALCRVVRKSE